ncbi:MAG TPA: DUF805 domain-containing protein [Allosphingosinicella sp.]|jgi:uncharacterized membrane protein YhaH (DUF805 family)
MMLSVANFDPSGRTDRRSYGLAVALLVPLGYAGSLALAVLLSPWVAVPFALVAWVALLLLTIRRLRDSGRSLWWALLFLWPVTIDIDLATLTCSGLDVHLLELAGIIRWMPVLIGLIAPREAAEAKANFA